MSEREGTPQDFARLAAKARGQDVPSKAEVNRALVESIHPPEPEPEPDHDAGNLMARLLAPKTSHAELIRALHGSEAPK